MQIQNKSKMNNIKSNTDIYSHVRKQFENDGIILSDDEFSYILNYTKRKAKVNGKQEDYIPLLLPDVMREFIISKYINLVPSTRTLVLE